MQRWIQFDLSLTCLLLSVFWLVLCLLGAPGNVLSFSETRAQQLVHHRAEEFLRLNHQQLSRIYPSAYRIDSSNFNPQAYWNVGCQLGERLLNCGHSDRQTHIHARTQDTLCKSQHKWDTSTFNYHTNCRLISVCSQWQLLTHWPYHGVSLWGPLCTAICSPRHHLDCTVPPYMHVHIITRPNHTHEDGLFYAYLSRHCLLCLHSALQLVIWHKISVYLCLAC